MDPSAHGLQWWLPTHCTVSLETFSSIVKKFSLREDCVQCKSKEATRIAVSQLEDHVYSGSTDVEGHASWHWSMVIFFTDDGLSFFQLSSLPGCRPWAGERMRGDAGWSHRWGRQGAAGAFRASCQRLRLPEAAFKHWKSSALQEWLGKATSVQDPDSVKCLNFDPRLQRSGGRRADRAGLDALWVESMFAKTPAAQICCFLSELQIFFFKMLWTKWTFGFCLIGTLRLLPVESFELTKPNRLQCVQCAAYQVGYLCLLIIVS